MRSSRLSRATFQPPWSLFLLPKEPSAGPWGDGNLTWTAPRAGGRLASVARDSQMSASRQATVKSRRAAVLVLPCAALLYLSLGMDWYHYKSDVGHEFDSDARIVFTGLDTYLTVVAIAAVALAVVALVWSRVIAGVLLGILSAIAVEQILYRLFEQPYADTFVSVTPQLGALLGFACA